MHILLYKICLSQNYILAVSQMKSQDCLSLHKISIQIYIQLSTMYMLAREITKTLSTKVLCHLRVQCHAFCVNSRVHIQGLKKDLDVSK